MNVMQYLYLLGPVGVRGIAKHAQMTHNEIWYELDAMLTMRIAREVREGQFELTEDGLLVLERMHPTKKEDDDQVEPRFDEDGAGCVGVAVLEGLR
ncbi:hypothetical protein [Singulisphaera sp. PoT]|uniref:hypothetical protein n=1 Tax=Singulisphaera sp. PoT TaxID=3411797 RepID=UPI003BF5B809